MANYIFEADGNYVNFNGGGNLWRLHKDSRCVAWHWDQTGDLFFDVYDQQYVVKAGDIGNVVIGGVTLTTAADFKTNIETIFPGLAGGGGAALGYLVYTALLNQSGTSAPVATVLTNTLGGTVVWSYAGVGIYNATLAGAFTANKTIIFTGDGSSDAAGKIYYIWASANVIEIDTSWSESPSDGMLNGASIEIRVYP